MLDGIERIEIYMRNIIAHEMGKYDPMASEKEDFLSDEARRRVYSCEEDRAKFYLDR